MCNKTLIPYIFAHCSGLFAENFAARCDYCRAVVTSCVGVPEPRARLLKLRGLSGLLQFAVALEVGIFTNEKL